MTQVRIAINGGAAHIHAYKRRIDGLKQLFFAGKTVIDFQTVSLRPAWFLSVEFKTDSSNICLQIRKMILERKVCKIN
jgi:hypothetical protein